MKKAQIIYLTIVIIFLVLTGYIAISSYLNAKQDNNILSEIIIKNLTGNKAIQYCIDNYEELYGDFNYRITYRCYNLINTRNSLQ